MYLHNYNCVVCGLIAICEKIHMYDKWNIEFRTHYLDLT